MKKDEIKWDKRYASNKIPLTPTSAVVAHYQLATTGTALDIAAGNCRNSIFLAENGFTVDAVDISQIGLDLQKNASHSIIRIHHDLDSYSIKKNSYNLILNINFLDRRLFPEIQAGLKPGGILIFETFMDPRLVGRELNPSKRYQYLDQNELLHAFLDLTILFYKEEQVEFANGDPIMKATLVGRKK